MQDLSPNDPKLISADKEITIPFVDFSYVAGATKPANNATVNATFKQDVIPT